MTNETGYSLPLRHEAVALTFHHADSYVFPLTDERTVILVRQYRPPIERVELGLPAGLVEPGEDPETAARRELAEETGYESDQWELLASISSSPSLKNNYAYLFLARGVRRVAKQDSDEHERLEVVEVPVEELPGKVHSCEIVSSSGVAAIMLALERLRN